MVTNVHMIVVTTPVRSATLATRHSWVGWSPAWCRARAPAPTTWPVGGQAAPAMRRPPFALTRPALGSASPAQGPRGQGPEARTVTRVVEAYCPRHPHSGWVCGSCFASRVGRRSYVRSSRLPECADGVFCHTGRREPDRCDDRGGIPASRYGRALRQLRCAVPCARRRRSWRQGDGVGRFQLFDPPQGGGDLPP